LVEIPRWGASFPSWTAVTDATNSSECWPQKRLLRIVTTDSPEAFPEFATNEKQRSVAAFADRHRASAVFLLISVDERSTYRPVPTLAHPKWHDILPDGQASIVSRKVTIDETFAGLVSSQQQ
jgi:hypothetical protein